MDIITKHNNSFSLFEFSKQLLTSINQSITINEILSKYHNYLNKNNAFILVFVCIYFFVLMNYFEKYKQTYMQEIKALNKTIQEKDNTIVEIKRQVKNLNNKICELKNFSQIHQKLNDIENRLHVVETAPKSEIKKCSESLYEKNQETVEIDLKTICSAIHYDNEEWVDAYYDFLFKFYPDFADMRKNEANKKEAIYRYQRRWNCNKISSCIKDLIHNDDNIEYISMPILNFILYISGYEIREVLNIEIVGNTNNVLLANKENKNIFICSARNGDKIYNISDFDKFFSDQCQYPIMLQKLRIQDETSVFLDCRMLMSYKNA